VTENAVHFYLVDQGKYGWQSDLSLNSARDINEFIANKYHDFTSITICDDLRRGSMLNSGNNGHEQIWQLFIPRVKERSPDWRSDGNPWSPMHRAQNTRTSTVYTGRVGSSIWGKGGKEGRRPRVLHIQIHGQFQMFSNFHNFTVNFKDFLQILGSAPARV
jgi:hypothetical protein